MHHESLNDFLSTHGVYEMGEKWMGEKREERGKGRGGREMIKHDTSY